MKQMYYGFSFKTACRIVSIYSLGIAGREHYEKSEIYAIIGSIVDGSKFKEFKSFFGPGLIAGTAYIEG